MVVTVEDNGAAGGYGDAVARALRAAGSPVPVHTAALDQAFVPHGSRGDLLAAAGIRRAIEDVDTRRRDMPHFPACRLSASLPMRNR